ncbi:putative RNA-directed DNA polymerase [Helianthus annuus]|nr:putative RNA-directed DNA polymerase [Helianthus annuus]
MNDKSTDPKNIETKSQSLHPVYTVTNIQHKVRILDDVEVSYPTWVKLFMLHATGYDVVNHIDGSPAPDETSDDYPSWKKIDAIVLQWIYGTLTTDLLVRVLEEKSTAHEAWLRVKNLFLNNKGSRDAALQHELTNLTLSAMPNLDAYCQKIRELADQLTAVDCPINNTQRILYLVRGLPREYDTTASILNQSLPTWEEACNQLQSEARRIAARDALSPTPAIAAVVDHPPKKNRSGSPPSHHDAPSPQRRYNGNRDGHRDNRRDNRRSSRSSPHVSGAPHNRSPSLMPYTPYWAPQQPYNQFWAPPPCPYPTQGWAQPWDARPTARNSSNMASSRQSTAQAHLTEADPMDPTQLADAVQALSMEPGDDQWHFDTGASSHDFKDGTILSRHNSTSDLYPLTPNASATACYASTQDSPFWHDRLGHPGQPVMEFLSSRLFISCNKIKTPFVCQSCQLSKHKRLPFSDSTTRTLLPFSILHCDLWTSPILSHAGYKYYMVLTDDFTQFTWVYPLKYKSETFTKFTHFHNFVKTQFNLPIKAFQCDMGGEFDNNNFKNFATEHGIQFRFSCPHTSQQNGKSERMIRRLNEIMFALLTHAKLPSSFWVEALHTASYLHNILPTKLHKNQTPTALLYLRQPTYDHLRVFGCLCYPNLSSTRPHKLALRSTPCIFLGYPANYRGYRCLELSTGKTIFSRHVTFDEVQFPFAHPSRPPPSHEFLDPSPLIFTQPTVAPFANTHPKHGPTQPPPTNLPPGPTPSPRTMAHASSLPGLNSPNRNIMDYGPPPLSSPSAPSTQPSPHASHSTLHQQPPHNQTTISLNLPPTTTSTHSMRTRSQSGIYKPRQLMSLNTITSPSIFPLPKSHVTALTDPNWKIAMTNEYEALLANNTWELVPRPANAPIIRCMWLFKHKFHADGTLERHKARLVVNGKSQTVGIDCDETFSPVVKPTTIRTVLSLATSRSWQIHQLDVKNAFLHGHLKETVYMFQPPGFTSASHPKHVCKLNRSLYGLKQAPRAWYQRFAGYISKCGFNSSVCDSSLFIYKKGDQMAYLLLYVDDIILTASSASLLKSIINSLSTEFKMTDLGPLHHFLGIAVEKQKHGIFLSQSTYAKDILSRAKMSNCKPASTPVEVGSKLSATAGALFSDDSLYRSLAGALQYLTITRPDISYAVQQVCLFMHAPREPYFQLLKRILRYIKGTLTQGLLITPSSSTKLTAYSDADWGGCPDSRRSTSGYCVFMGDNLISWSSKRQPTISRSSAEAEYRGVANTVSELSWIRNLLLELHLPVRHASIVYCDNISAVYLAENPVQHQRTKHIELDIHFVREKVRLGTLKVLHVPADYQYADIFTKGLPKHLFQRFRSSLCLRSSTAQTAGDC